MYEVHPIVRVGSTPETFEPNHRIELEKLQLYSLHVQLLHALHDLGDDNAIVLEQKSPN
tara:strand:+ start:453 stop:629 length:177 start_codon:yes stop_codon:yes gene_type:complete